MRMTIAILITSAAVVWMAVALPLMRAFYHEILKNESYLDGGDWTMLVVVGLFWPVWGPFFLPVKGAHWFITREKRVKQKPTKDWVTP
jgi:hypothetical protein